jgi:hypothetical protein
MNPDQLIQLGFLPLLTKQQAVQIVVTFMEEHEMSVIGNSSTGFNTILARVYPVVSIKAIIFGQL